MTRFLQKLSRLIDRLNEGFGKGVSWLTTGLIALTVFDVLTRYLFRQSQTWAIELEWHLFALIFLWGAGYALRHDRHVRVDLFYTRFTPRDQARVNFWGTLFLLLPWCLLIIWASWPFARISFLSLERSPDPGGLPFRFAIKFALILGFVLLFLQGISQGIQAGLQLWKQEALKDR